MTVKTCLTRFDVIYFWRKKRGWKRSFHLFPISHPIQFGPPLLPSELGGRVPSPIALVVPRT